jgi:hypothetical protein
MWGRGKGIRREGPYTTGGITLYCYKQFEFILDVSKATTCFK